MLKIGGLQLGEIPRVVLGVEGNSTSLAQAQAAGVDIFEVRIDRFEQLESARVVNEIKAIKQHGLPLIGTIRSPKEKGQADIVDAKRLALYQAIAPLVDAVDIELNSASILKETIAAARKHEIAIIVSSHNFSETPSDEKLQAIIEKAEKAGADIIKIATLAKQKSDVLRLLQLTSKHRSQNLVTIAMGATGSISRLAFPLAGSLMTYTSVSPSDGQIPLQQLIDHLRLYYPAYNQELIIRLELLEYA